MGENGSRHVKEPVRLKHSPTKFNRYFHSKEQMVSSDSLLMDDVMPLSVIGLNSGQQSPSFNYVNAIVRSEHRNRFNGIN
jgi:hypothetical protein